MFYRFEIYLSLALLALTGTLFLFSLNHHSRSATQEFEYLAQDGIDVLNSRLQTYLLTIRAAAAFVSASDDVSAEDFEIYVEALDLATHSPSLTGLGLVVEVPQDETDTFAQTMRAEVDPNFQFRRLSQEETHFVIKYMQPALQNAQAIGLDLTFSKERLDVLRQAVETGSPQLTPPVQLVQSEASRIGSVIYAPILAAAAQTGEPDTFFGWINAAFVMNNLFSGLTSAQGQNYTVWAYDGDTVEDGLPLYDGNRPAGLRPAFSKVHQIEKFGRTWTVEFVSTPRFEEVVHTYRPLSILIAGLTITAMLIAIVQNIRQRSKALTEISELKSRQIEEREKENRSLVENEVTPIFLLDGEDQVLFANAAAQRCFGRTAEDMHMSDFGAIAQKAAPLDGSYNAKGRSSSGDVLELDLDRNEWTSGSGDKRSTVIIHDLTGQNAAQRALRQSKAIFDMALQGSEIGVFDVDLRTGKSDVSDTWCRIMGYEPGCNGMDTQKNFISRIHPDDLDILIKADTDCFAGKTARSIADYRLRTKDGGWCWMRSDAVVVERDDQGEALRLIGTQTDVSELRQNRNALEQSEKLFRQVIEHAPIGMALMDHKGNFISVNSAFSTLCGRSQEELVNGTRLADLIPSEDRKGIYTAISQLLSEQKQTVYSAEHRILMPNGEQRWGSLNVSWSLDKNEDENENFYIGQVIDITDQKNVDRMKDEFVSTVSHELRTPLTSIKGALGLLTAGKNSTLLPAQLRLIEIAKSNADRLTNIVNDILDLQKISSGEVTFNNAEFDFKDILNASVEQMSPFAVAHDSSIKVDMPDGPLTVYVDNGRTQQVLANLISNACKYSDPDSEVLVKAERLDDQLIVYVQNVGSGVPESFRSKVFKPFSQADSSDTRASGGTGLGLNITRQIVLRQGGQIGFESVPGGVTVFWFTIPIAMETVDSRPTAKIEPAKQDRLAILHVEDDHDFAEVLAAALTGFADVQHAKSIATAEKLIKRERLDVVILDWMLPDGDASELISEITRFQPGANIIGLSANSKQTDDPRLFANIVKSKAEMATVVASINKCTRRAS